MSLSPEDESPDGDPVTFHLVLPYMNTIKVVICGFEGTPSTIIRLIAMKFGYDIHVPFRTE